MRGSSCNFDANDINQMAYSSTLLGVWFPKVYWHVVDDIGEHPIDMLLNFQAPGSMLLCSYSTPLLRTSTCV